MATTPEEDDDVLDLTADQQLDADGGDDDDQGAQGGADGDDDEGSAGEDDAGGSDDEEVTIVSFGDDAAELDQDGDSSTIRNLRKELREAKTKLREVAKPEPVKRELRPKPTSADHSFDDEAFAEDLEKWFGEKAEADRDAAQANEAQQVIQREWEADVARFETEKASLAVPDLADAQDMIASTFNLAQQAVIVKAAEKPALLMYALAQVPAKAAELAKITDVIKLAAAIAKVEGTVKVTKGKRNRPAIDTPQRGSGSLKSSDKRLDELEKEAERTGERTKLVNYKRELAKKK